LLKRTEKTRQMRGKDLLAAMAIDAIRDEIGINFAVSASRVFLQCDHARPPVR